MDHVHKVSVWRHERHYASWRTVAEVPNGKPLSQSSPGSRMVQRISGLTSPVYLPSEGHCGTTPGEKHDLQCYTLLLSCLDLHTSSVSPDQPASFASQG